MEIESLRTKKYPPRRLMASRSEANDSGNQNAHGFVGFRRVEMHAVSLKLGHPQERGVANAEARVPERKEEGKLAVILRPR